MYEKIIVGEKKASDMEAAFESAGLRTPEAATIMITGRCNLHCRHCWPESGGDSGAGAVSEERVLGAISGFASLGCEFWPGRRLRIAFTETRRNFEELPVLLDFAEKTGVDASWFGRCIR